MNKKAAKNKCLTLNLVVEDHRYTTRPKKKNLNSNYSELWIHITSKCWYTNKNSTANVIYNIIKLFLNDLQCYDKYETYEKINFEVNDLYTFDHRTSYQM